MLARTAPQPLTTSGTPSPTALCRFKRPLSRPDLARAQVETRDITDPSRRGHAVVLSGQGTRHPGITASHSCAASERAQSTDLGSRGVQITCVMAICTKPAPRVVEAW
jgi:hypothetical protein